MKAAVFKGNGVLTVEEVTMPKIELPEDVLVKVKAASICGSDLHILSLPPGQYGEPGTIMGHEFVAEVVETGEGVTYVAAGDEVVIEPNIRCGICPECRSGRENLCRSAINIGQWRNGGFAEYCVVPQKQLHLIPKEIPLKEAALTEPLACVMNGMIRINPMPHEKVVIFGAGAIGLIFLRVLKCFGVQDIVVCETEESRKADAMRCGADAVVNPSEENLEVYLVKRWGSMCNVAIDAVGADVVLEQAIDIMECGGRILVFGQNLTQVSQIPPGIINCKELMILGTLSTIYSFPAAIALLNNPGLKLHKIISHEISLGEIERGIDLMRSKEAVKVIVYPGGVK